MACLGAGDPNDLIPPEELTPEEIAEQAKKTAAAIAAHMAKR